MLLSRAIKSIRIVGHAYFWALNSALHDPYSFERLYLHYERFLFLCPHYRNEINLQTRINEIIIDTNFLSINNIDHKVLGLTDRINKEIDKVKSELDIDYFILPHKPDIPLKNIKKFNTRNSKNHTVMITCDTVSETGNEDFEIKALFKQGKDLIKDQIAIQAFRIFDNFCLEKSFNGKPFNLCMTTYTVLATGYKIGYIEIVPNSKNLLAIHKKYPQCNKFPLSYSIINNLRHIVKKHINENKSSGNQPESYAKMDFSDAESSHLLGDSSFEKSDKFEL